MSSVEFDSHNAISADPVRRGDRREMDQVRDLLFGNAQRQVNERMELLDRSMHDLEAKLDKRLDRLEAELAEREARLSAQHNHQLSELGRALAQLGEKVIALAAANQSGSNGHDRDPR